MRNSFLLMALMVVAVSLSGCLTPDNSQRIEEHKKLAGELIDNNLYTAAIEEYKKILDYPDVDLATQANINYLIGKVYFEQVTDYENGAAYYIRARELDPNGSFVTTANRNIVTAFEKMGHVVDARRELKTLTDIDASTPEKGDVVVATIGDKKIYLSEINRQIQTLPPQVQKEFASKAGKRKFIDQYVGMELLFRAAERENYGSDPEIMRQKQEFYKKLLVEKYMAEKVAPNIQIDSLDVKNFYAAHKADRYNNAPYDSVMTRVFYDYQSEKGNQAVSNYVDQLARTEQVKIMEQNIR